MNTGFLVRKMTTDLFTLGPKEAGKAVSPTKYKLIFSFEFIADTGLHSTAMFMDPSAGQPT